MRQPFVFRALAAAIAVAAGAFWLASAAFVPAGDTYRVIHAYPHDEHAFTQGLIYLNGHLYESTGLPGRSSLREEDLESGRIVKYLPLPGQYFGEGLTNWDDTLIQLTWQAHLGFVYDLKTFQLLRTFHYAGEGWGLTQTAKT